MPYTPLQVRVLSGMGIVPWIKRSDTSAAELLAVVQSAEQAIVSSAQTYHHGNPPADVHIKPQSDLTAKTDQLPVATATIAAAATIDVGPVASLMQTPLVEIPFRGQRCSQLGKADAPLLVLVEAVSQQQNQYPFESTDAKLFDDMLRAIAWRRQDVCLAVLPPSNQADLIAADDGPRVADLCKPHRDAVLLFRHTMPDSLNADELVVPMERTSMMAWQLPHPALLRESPQRKRQAWNVLKAARARLQ